MNTHDWNTLVNQKITIITKKDSVYVGTLACVPHHGRLLLNDMNVYHKNGFFKACSGAPNSNSRLFKLSSIKSASLTVFVQDEDLTHGYLSIVRVPGVYIFEFQFPKEVSPSKVMVCSSNGRQIPSDHVAVWIKHPEKRFWVASTFPKKDLPKT